MLKFSTALLFCSFVVGKKQVRKSSLMRIDLHSMEKYKPKTINQEMYVNLLNDETSKLVVCTGPAGSGKTLFACSKAVHSLKMNKVEKIVLTKPLVTVDGENIGFLPGSVQSKISPWIESFMDIFKQYYSSDEIKNMIKTEVISVLPLGFLRGKTFDNSFILCDECQNTTPSQLKMLMTRMGENTRLVLTGDEQQKDLNSMSGLSDFISRYKRRCAIVKNEGDYIRLLRLKDISFMELGDEDVLRSGIVRTILEIYK